jgi:hypothetical protein
VEVCRHYRHYILALLVLLASAVASAGEPRIQVGVTPAGEGFTVEATIEAPVTQKTAWEVLVDYDHMTSIMSNLTLSKVLSRHDNTLVVRQEGVAKYGLLSFSFESEREIQLEPMKRIQSRTLSGTAKRMETETWLSQAGDGHGVQIKYHSEVVPGSSLARMFGASALQQQVEDQFRSMVAEMKKREPERPAVAAAQGNKPVN